MSSIIPTPKRLSLAVAGLGRMGKQHVVNALHFSPRIHLAAVSTPAKTELDWANENLIPHGVKVFSSLDELLANGKFDALLIASATKVHFEQVMTAMAHGLHVLCEKPLAMNLDQCKKILEATHQDRNKDLKIMTAFSRRFDLSYINAKKAIESGRIGKPVVIRCDNRDLYERTDGMINYLKNNPGIFIDSGVHDIDLSISFLGESIRPKSCYAVGSVSMHHELNDIGDADNAVGIIEWYAEDADPITYCYCSRIMQHGFDNPTEIIGTKGVLKINLHPRRDLLTIADANGIGNDVMPDYFERYEQAFVTELNTFASCVLDDKALPYKLDTAVMGMEIAQALQESFRTGRKVCWGKDGRRVE
ncbi:putative oxidoreductase [Acrodontium crateriforme]|uniref:Oxidoreductase n=1 Tax=Acrodontium crateriforme TaxID=150365 RepID=A0AAQ3RCV5_9PEZI|nr:putative oxidoreductase [Acrodontium crateriforme]